MFAGVPGAGAEEGWYTTQLDFEIKRLTGSQVTAASIDVYKCFDQIVRPLVIALAQKAGMPPNILHTYEVFQQKLVVHNQIGSSLGTPHQHRCSIPQGCPFSMTLIALLMKPWISYMRQEQLTPRVLADDLFIYATREQHASKAAVGMRLSREYFVDIGAQVADSKCFLASTCPDTRQKLRQMVWDNRGTKIKVVTHFRDLGAHVGLDQQNRASTSTRRLRQATKMVRSLRWKPVDLETKIKTINTTILPAALYGSEVGQGAQTGTTSTSVGDRQCDRAYLCPKMLGHGFRNQWVKDGPRPKCPTADQEGAIDEENYGPISQQPDDDQSYDMCS